MTKVSGPLWGIFLTHTVGQKIRRQDHKFEVKCFNFNAVLVVAHVEAYRFT